MILTSALLIPALLLLLLCWLNRNLDAPADQPLELRQPLFVQCVYLFSVLGFGATAIFLPLTTGNTGHSPYLAAMALLASLIAPFGFISRIRYGDGGLTIRTCLGRVHALRWEEITAVQAGAVCNPETGRRKDGFIVARGRRFCVNYAMAGAEDFIRRAQQECGQGSAPAAKPD